MTRFVVLTRGGTAATRITYPEDWLHRIEERRNGELRVPNDETVLVRVCQHCAHNCSAISVLLTYRASGMTCDDDIVDQEATTRAKMLESSITIMPDNG